MKTHRRMIGLLTASLTTLVMMTGCAGGQPKTNQRQSAHTIRTGLPIEPAAADALGYVSNWATSLALDNGQHVREARIIEPMDLVIVIEQPTNVTSAISLRDGSIQWRDVLGPRDSTLYGGVAVDEDRVLFNTRDRVFVVDAESGQTQSVNNLKSPVASAPVIVDEQYAVFGGRNGRIFAHGIDTGYPEWSYQLTGPILTSPVLTDNMVFAADSKGVYAALSASNGALRWRNHTWATVNGQPTSGNNDIYVSSVDRSLYALNQTTGRDHWIYRLNSPLEKGPTFLANHVFQPVADDGLHALDSQSGQRQWKFPAQAEPIITSENKVLLKREQSGLAWVELESGRVSTQVPTRALHSVLSGPDNSLIAVTPNGRLLRLNRR